MYRNHVQRVLAFYRLLQPNALVEESVKAAALFHDLGIWTARSWDYLDASANLASDYLSKTGREPEIPLVRALILNHHRMTGSAAEITTRSM